MSQGKSKPKKVKCRICGDYFDAMKRSAKHCEAAKARKSGEAANRPRCLRCGSRYSVDSSGYCATCRSNGLDSVHKETGRTNGWDRPATAKVKAVGGWRGRPVAGRSIRGDMTVLLEDAP